MHYFPSSKQKWETPRVRARTNDELIMRHGANLPHIRFPALAEELRWRRRGRASIFAGYVNPKEQRKRSLIPQPLE
ncbi:hypothetical protein [Alloprevotella tannerae]|jgi:hypothetical protein|uniref:hypothetical protein n=1 Tax=Alloprevotella tannerae TaxID=76122 RepID=UPI0028F0B5C0|nr:hypothetical protein [Alloprevotella tannerae]